MDVADLRLTRSTMRALVRIAVVNISVGLRVTGSSSTSRREPSPFPRWIVMTTGSPEKVSIGRNGLPLIATILSPRASSERPAGVPSIRPATYHSPSILVGTQPMPV